MCTATTIQHLAGRLGFEPRQSAPKALDLPLVDRPKTLEVLRRRPFFVACSALVFREQRTTIYEQPLHRLPVLRPRQGRGRDRRDRLGLERRYRLHRGRLAREQPVHRGPGAREGRVLCARVFQRSLDVT